jgi:hypothetical protein
MDGQGLMHLQSSSEVTSNQVCRSIEGLSDTTSDTDSFDHPFHKFFSERVLFFIGTQESIVRQRLRTQESAYPSNFRSNIYIKASKQNYLVSSFKGTYHIVIHHHGHISFNELPDPFTFWVEGPPDDAWTVQSWVLDAGECEINYGDEIESLKGELHDLLSGFNKGISLSRPVELLQMAEKVAEQIKKKKEEDIDNWAEDLSRDLSKLSD